ncbi:unnamed protein product [Phytomonas sp. EM1]|nr:unnamed protein product [Phytomonas sp. EM1]|eukprot:CCW64034.1 unnamed protein product [Phytomonas sp. isolate EM1]
MFNGVSGNNELLFNVLSIVQTSGEPIVCPTLSLLGDLETFVNEVRRRALRIAAFPSGGITIFPIIPVEELDLIQICEDYCRLETDVDRANMRYNLYLREYPLFDSQSYSRDALYHPADCVVRLAELCLKVVRMPQTNFMKLVAYTPYLHIDQIKLLCKTIYFRLHPNIVQETNPASEQLGHRVHYPNTGLSINESTEGKAGWQPFSSVKLDELFQRGAIESTKENEEVGEDLTGQEQVDDAGEEAEYLSESDYELVTYSSTFYNGEDEKKRLAAVYIPGGISPSICQTASRTLESAATRNNLRAATNGGTPPETGIVGYYDYLTNPTQHKCRETQFMRKNWSQVMTGCKGLIQSLDNLYRSRAPVHYSLQRIAIPPHFELFGSVFSTMTVNRNFRTAVHTDSGDFRCGLGALCVIDGEFDGCHLAIKPLKKAFRLKTGDVLFFDTSLEHGNTEVLNPECAWRRISVVCYLRNGLMSSVCELERRKHLNRLIVDKLANAQALESIVNINGVDETLPPLYVPAGLVNRLAPVQLSALNFAAERGGRNSGCVLAMTMGIGKTLVALTLCFSYFFRYPNRDILVLAPKPIISHWVQEQKKWESYGLQFNRLVASDRADAKEFDEKLNLFDRQLSGDQRKEGHLFILNPEYLMSTFSKRFKRFDPQIIIVDEGHRVATKGNKLIESLSKYKCPLRVVLSGTPLQNNTKELYRLVSWVNREICKVIPERLFDDFANDISRYVAGDDNLFKKALIAQQFIQDWMKGFIFREMKVDLPPLHDYILICNSSEAQRCLEKEIGVRRDAGIMKATDHRPSHLSAHPLCYLAYIIGGYQSLSKLSTRHERGESSIRGSKDKFLEVERYHNIVQNGEIDLFTASSGKLTALIKIVQQVQTKGEKVIIFSQYIGAQDIIHRTLTAYKISTFTVRGRDSQGRRQYAIELFSQSDEMVALVLSTKVAAFGLDFTAANHVILFDTWWNPQVDAQAVARAYRRNQQKPVTVYRLASWLEGGSILKMQTRKMALFNCIMHEKTSRSAHSNEIHDCSDSEPNPDKKMLWQSLKESLLEGGYPVLQAVYLYRDTVKDTDLSRDELDDFNDETTTTF